MKKIIAIALLILILATLAVGCGGQSNFEQAEQLVNDAFDSLEANVNEMLSIITSEGVDIDGIDEFTERMNEINDEIGSMLISVDAQLSELNLTQDEDEQLEEHAEYRLGILITLIMELQDEMLETLQP